ncbi:HNH endonuclease [Shewanella sp. SP2S2-4]|uniref:HNH endonuclease n=1 Tax=Shewanella sp. SP2S2-4 TaxID=3063539 RepID=UPI0028911DCA|nr:HNH endonuclease [Shewanella sp. SP2S2-4]MDT3275900.1 HNH endonuclease [Shewanella sp. SP2S2-4]
MKFWWVNHKQTYKQEVEGGYIWSPKTNSNGAKNQTYINLKLIKPGDIVFSYASTLIKAIGTVTEAHSEQPKPDFGVAGDAWSNVGWKVSIRWEILKQPIRPKAHIDKIKTLLPGKNAPLQTNGNGNQSCYLAAIGEELGNLIFSLARETDNDLIDALELELKDNEEEEAVASINSSSLDVTEKQQQIMARRGQGVFRKNVETIELSCRVTGIRTKNLLIASHIKPWRVSANSERLDGNNGLLLSPHIDKLFDGGWISFEDNGELLCSGPDIVATLETWGVRLPNNVGEFNQDQAKYLDFHRSEVFKGSYFLIFSNMPQTEVQAEALVA